MTLTLVTAPPAATGALSLADAKSHLRVTHTDEDDYITGLIALAVAHLDGKTGILNRALLTQTWDYAVPTLSFCAQALPLRPIQSITSLKYYDEAGAEQTIAATDYRLATYEGFQTLEIPDAIDVVCDPERIEPVTIRYVAGYGATGADLPPSIVHAIRLLVGHYYENREATARGAIGDLPLGVDALLAPFRSPMVAPAPRITIDDDLGDYDRRARFRE